MTRFPIAQVGAPLVAGPTIRLRQRQVRPPARTLHRPCAANALAQNFGYLRTSLRTAAHFDRLRVIF